MEPETIMKLSREHLEQRLSHFDSLTPEKKKELVDKKMAEIYLEINFACEKVSVWQARKTELEIKIRCLEESLQNSNWEKCKSIIFLGE